MKQISLLIFCSFFVFQLHGMKNFFRSDPWKPGSIGTVYKDMSMSGDVWKDAVREVKSNQIETQKKWEKLVTKYTNGCIQPYYGDKLSRQTCFDLIDDIKRKSNGFRILDIKKKALKEEAAKQQITD